MELVANRDSPRQRCLEDLDDETLATILGHLEDPRDRSAASRVCKKWHLVDGLNRKNVYVSNCYSIAPSGLSRRFLTLEKIKIKGKPRAYEFDLLVDNWGGHAGPWIDEIARSYPRLQSLHLRRMEVTDEDLEVLAAGCASLQKLKLDKCSGFTTLGLRAITRSCRTLRVLDVEESEMDDKGGQWLWELLHNRGTLDSLNIASQGLEEGNVDKALLAVVKRARTIASLKVSDMELEKFRALLKHCAAPVAELGLGCYSNSTGDHKLLAHSLRRCLARLKILDLKFAMLNSDDQTELLSHCHCLEELEVRSLVGDKGLQVVGKTCTKLKRIRVDQDTAEHITHITQTGMIAICEGCRDLQFLVMYLSNINNEALAAVGRYLPNLTDFRIVLLEVLDNVEDLPLDNGVRLLLQGCPMLTRFSVYLRAGGLSDRGVAYIGEFGEKLKWILLGCSGESDEGLRLLAEGCRQLERLELRGCPFGEEELARAVVSLPSLKYVWVQGIGATTALGEYLVKNKAGFLVEVMAEINQVLGYYSLAGPRTDCPDSVRLISPADLESCPDLEDANGAEGV